MAETNYISAGKDLTATRFNQREFQLQRKNHFEVQFHSDFIDPDLRFMLVSFPLPKETTETSDINYFNQTIKVAGKTTFDNTTMVLRDAIEFDTERRFLNWRKRVYDPATGLMGLAADYKSEATVIEYTPNKEQYRKWRIIGCFPSGIDYGDLTYDDGGEKQLSITITYDYAYRMDIDTTV
jgi:hypothetical protein